MTGKDAPFTRRGGAIISRRVRGYGVGAYGNTPFCQWIDGTDVLSFVPPGQGHRCRGVGNVPLGKGKAVSGRA